MASRTQRWNPNLDADTTHYQTASPRALVYRPQRDDHTRPVSRILRPPPKLDRPVKEKGPTVRCSIPLPLKRLWRDQGIPPKYHYSPFPILISINLS
ncbi:hypothetical protein HO173_011109 [Letharia columbiana]|uniref:Uncharacterized protein n=1 Tax=Letharia columbiana TaxID=112416 RepID=A0A8H6FL76_9LECA|nr:uncharacterized protein HO173_011109 [Letharia columbiana]KAF6230572.1 hypothetical protein HO173_011109 [Letharia columbiana]